MHRTTCFFGLVLASRRLRSGVLKLGTPRKTLAEPGEAVGVIAAQSMGRESPAHEISADETHVCRHFRSYCALFTPIYTVFMRFLLGFSPLQQVSITSYRRALFFRGAR